MSKNIKKTQSFQPRPKPPTIEQIHEDIKGAPDDDLVFVCLRNSSDSENNSLMTDSYEDSMEDSTGMTPGVQNDTETSYKDAINFLQLHEKLKKSSDNLREQYKYLEQMGKELRDSIDNLKQQAEG